VPPHQLFWQQYGHKKTGFFPYIFPFFPCLYFSIIYYFFNINFLQIIIDYFLFLIKPLKKIMIIFHNLNSFLFSLYKIVKNNQTDFFFKKTETGSNRPVSVRFGFLGQKPIQTGLARFF
jgi:hypothetical protein